MFKYEPADYELTTGSNLKYNEKSKIFEIVA